MHFLNVSCLMTKPTKWPLRPAKTQISMGIRPVWSESSQCTQRFFMRTAKTLIRLGGCTGWSVSSLGAMVILLLMSCDGSLYIAAESPSIDGEADCGSKGRWFDSGPATYRALKLIMRIFSLIGKGRCQMFNLLNGWAYPGIVWLQT